MLISIELDTIIQIIVALIEFKFIQMNGQVLFKGEIITNMQISIGSF
jgi:hypothetical protein